MEVDENLNDFEEVEGTLTRLPFQSVIMNVGTKQAILKTIDSFEYIEKEKLTVDDVESKLLDIKNECKKHISIANEKLAALEKLKKKESKLRDLLSKAKSELSEPDSEKLRKSLKIVEKINFMRKLILVMMSSAVPCSDDEVKYCMNINEMCIETKTIDDYKKTPKHPN